MAKLLLNFAYIITATVVILSNAQQNAISNNNKLNQSTIIVQMQSHTLITTTIPNNITNIGIQNANKIIQLPATNGIATDTTIIEQIAIIPSSDRRINQNISIKEEINSSENVLKNNGNNKSEIDVMPTVDNVKFEEFTLAQQLKNNDTDSTTTTTTTINDNDDLEPINNIDDRKRNIYKIAKSDKLIPPKRHIPETVFVPFKSNNQMKNNNHLHRYERNGKDGKTNLNIFHIITDLYDQSQWNIDGIRRSVSEICSNDMEIYLKALNNGEPWAIKG